MSGTDVNISVTGCSSGGASPAEPALALRSKRQAADKKPRHARSHRNGKQRQPIATTTTTAGVAVPVYPVELHTVTHHGDARTDAYHWLANRKDPRVRAVMERENTALEHFFADSQPYFPTGAAPLRKELFREMRRRWKEDDVSLPSLDRSYWYYARHVKNAEYPIFCRRPYSRETGVNVDFLEEMCEMWRRDPTAVMPTYNDEVIFLDLNLLERELKLESVELGEMDISPSENELAVTLDCSGGKEVYTLFILPIRHVNYAQWLARDSDVPHRAWARELEQTRQSVYTPFSPTAAVGSQASSAASGSSARPRKSASRSSLASLGGGGSASSGGGSAACGSSKKTAVHMDAGCENVTEDARSASSAAASPASPSGGGRGTFPSVPPPRHVIRHRIDIFDLSSEVLWVAPQAVLYSAVDGKMRPYQLVYHDLTVADQAAASHLCYEEEDEAFWVGSLCFTADDAYVVFSSASTEVSEWYAIPVSAAARGLFYEGGANAPVSSVVPPICNRSVDGCNNRTLVAVPFAQPAMALAAGVGEGDRAVGVAPVLRFSNRADCAVEYDLDHHPALLFPPPASPGGDGCAWLMTSNAKGCTNFCVFFLPVVTMATSLARVEVSPDGTTTSSSTLKLHSLPSSKDAESWQPLFAYDERVKVDSVDNYYHFLSVAVRCDGYPTTLLCPIQLVWRWWAAAGPQAAGGGPLGGPLVPIPLDDLFDLSNLLSLFPQLRVTGKATGESAEASCTATLSTEAGGLRVVATAHATEAASPTAPPSSLATVPAALASVPGLEATPLRTCVECYPCSTSYHDTCWRVSVTHVLHPALQLQCEFTSATVHSTTAITAVGVGPLPLGALRVSRLREEFVNGMDGYCPEAYDGAVVWVPSDHYGHVDGSLVPTEHPSPAVRIPVTMCWRRDRYALGANAVVAHVYGSYGDCNDPDFSTERLTLLDRGVAWAYAAVRGGGEIGIPWRDQGRKLQRGTTVNDFISVAAYLQDTGLCRPGRLVSCGGSAGGIAVCRAMTAAPALFFAVLGAAPFVDCLTSLLDDDLPLSVTEREEFGDPVTDPAAYRLIKALSPMDTVDALVASQVAASSVVAPPRLPHVLLQTSWEDTRVGYWEPLKLTANLRARVYAHAQAAVVRQRNKLEKQRQDENGGGSDHEYAAAAAALVEVKRAYPHLHFCCDFSAGHAGSSGRYEQLKEIAREYGFILALLQRCDD